MRLSIFFFKKKGESWIIFPLQGQNSERPKEQRGQQRPQK